MTIEGPMGPDRVMVVQPAIPPLDAPASLHGSEGCEAEADTGEGMLGCWRPDGHAGDRHYDGSDKAEWWYA
jgi:hypothetical protein